MSVDLITINPGDDNIEVEYFGSEPVNIQFVGVGSPGPAGAPGVITPELQALRDQSITARDQANLARDTAITAKVEVVELKTSVDQKEKATALSAKDAEASLLSTQTLLTDTKTVHDQVVEIYDDTLTVKAEIQALNVLGQTSATTAVQAASGADGHRAATEALLGQTQTVRNEVLASESAIAGLRNETVQARNAAQTAATNSANNEAAGALHVTAASEFADAAEASAKRAAQFDPLAIVLKSNNGSDFADPAAVRVNIGAQVALSTVSQSEAEAGVATNDRNWSSQRVKQAIAANAAAKTHTHAITDVTGLDTALNLKAPLASPVFSGVATVPTASADTSNLQIANTAFVKRAIDELISGAPGALDTLQELANALGDDPNFAATITSALADKAALGHTHTMAEITGLATAIAALAPKASPVFTGNPTAVTQAASDNTTKLATTAHVKAAITASGLATKDHSHAMADITGLVDELAKKAASVHKHVAADITDLSTVLSPKADLASPVFTGAPTAPTQTVGDKTTRLATTEFVFTSVENAVSGKAETSHNHAISDVTGLQSAIDEKSPVATPTFTGSPKAPTAPAGTSTTQLATTAFVTLAISSFSTNLAIGGIAGLQNALDLRAPLVSPTFTGTPAAPTAAAGSNTTQLATTAFVAAGLATKAATSHTHTAADITGLDTTLASKAPVASPTFTGTVNAATIVASGNISAYSDERLKTNIETIEGALAMVNRMRGVRFTMNGKRGIGVVAQDFQKEVPELVEIGEDDNKTLSVVYGNTVGILIEAIKEMSHQIDALKKAT